MMVFESHYNVVSLLLLEKNFGATFFIITNQTESIYGKEVMNSNQIQFLLENNFEIGSHTLNHVYLSNLTDKEIGKELKESKKFLEENYDIVVDSVAFPYKDYNENILNIAKKYYLNAKVIYNGRPTGFLIQSFGLNKNTDVQSICEYVNYAYENNLWLVLTFHDVDKTPLVWGTSVDDFKEILNCVEKIGIEVNSISGCRAKF